MKALAFSCLSVICICVMLLANCKARDQYADPTLWFKESNKAGTADFDVFYVLPTCVWNRIDSNGDTLRYADPYSESDRKAMLPSFELAERIFGKEANFYSPYYSQISLESWKSDSLVKALSPRSMAEVKEAFDYYFKNINNGRPFALAGFSQGARCVVELLKSLDADQCRKLVAAYVIGYGITASDTLNHWQIKPARGKTDTGVAVCYNSVAFPQAISQGLNPGVVCINPVSWTSSPEKAWLNDTVSVNIDSAHHVLIVDGFNPENYYHPSLDFLFKKGNYHLQELLFYSNCLSENLHDRCQAFKSRESSEHL